MRQKRLIAVFIVLYYIFFSAMIGTGTMLVTGCATIKNPDGTALTPIQQMTQLGYKSSVMYEAAREQYLAYHDAPDTPKEQVLWLEKNLAPKIDMFQDTLVSYNDAVIKAAKGQGGTEDLARLDGEYNKAMQAAAMAMTQFVTSIIKKVNTTKAQDKAAASKPASMYDKLIEQGASLLKNKNNK